MQPTDAIDSAANVLCKIFLLLLCLAISGCGNTCVSGFFNPNGGSAVGAANNLPSCPLDNGTGQVFASIAMGEGEAAAPGNSPAALPRPLVSPHSLPNNIQHIFVTLRGIEAHPGSVADANSSAWQGLAPDLAAHPMQFDLLSPDSDSSSSTLATSTNVPATVLADEYRQLRLQLMTLPPAPDGLLPESNACGTVGWNCIVFADSSVRPLQFDSPAAEFLIPLQQGTATLFRVLPAEVVHLSITFDLSSSVFVPSDAAVRLVPVFGVVSRSSSPAPSGQ